MIEYDDSGNIKKITDESIKTFSLTNKYAIACERYFPITRKTDSTTIKRISKLMEELYPGQQLDTAIKTIEMNKDFVMKNIIGERKSRDNKYHLPLDGENDLLGNEILFDSKEEAEKYVVETYLPKINEKFSKELRALGTELTSIASESSGTKSKTERLFEMARGFSKNKDTQE